MDLVVQFNIQIKVMKNKIIYIIYVIKDRSKRFEFRFGNSRLASGENLCELEGFSSKQNKSKTSALLFHHSHENNLIIHKQITQK